MYLHRPPGNTECPLYAGPRSGDGVREVERSETRMQGQDFLVPFGGAGHPGDCQKELAQQRETEGSDLPKNGLVLTT